MGAPSATDAARAIELFAGVLFALAFLRRRGDRESGVAALLCLAAAAHATGVTVSAHASPFAAVAAERAAWVGLVAALPLALILQMVARRVPRRWAQRTIYVTVVAFIVTKAATRNINVSTLQSQSMFEELRKTCEQIEEQIGQRQSREMFLVWHPVCEYEPRRGYASGFGRLPQALPRCRRSAKQP